MPINGEHFTRIGGLGPPPRTVTFITDDTQLTVVDVPGDRLDLVRLLGTPDGRRGNLVSLPVLSTGERVDLIGIVDEQVFRAVDGTIALPIGEPVDLWAVIRRDGVATGLAFRRLNQPEVWTHGIEMRPTIALDQSIDIEVPRPPNGWVRAELTIAGLRTGLVLGEGLAGPGDAIRIARPAGADVPDGGLWLTARAAQFEHATHVPLDTAAAGLEWADDPAISPRPGPLDAGAVMARERPRLRWQPGPGLMRADFELTDGCSRERWQIVAPAALGELDLPLPPGRDPLARPLLIGSVRLDEIADASYAARLNGALGPAFALPQHSNRVQVRGNAGAWRAGPASCSAHPVQGRWFAHPTDAACVPGEAAQAVIVDRCGNLIPLPEAPALCGTILGGTVELRAGSRLQLAPRGDGWRLGDAWILRPPLTPVQDAPPELLGEWFQVSASEQAYEVGPNGPGVAMGSELIIETGNPSAGPWATIDREGRIEITLRNRPLSAILVGYDGATARLLIDGRACLDTPPEATARDDDGVLVIEEWVPDEGVLRRWRLTRG